jgi:nicotinate-nucleotide adenylyltransferase
MGNPAAFPGSIPLPPAPPSTSAGSLPPLVRPDARVGLFGGTFDPVHLGHLAVARAALQDLALDHLFFIPAAQAALRSGPPAASTADRLDLLHLALAEAAEPRLGILDLEARAGGLHYTVDTVRRLRVDWPAAHLFWLLGSDQLAQLDRWHHPEELARLVEFAVLDRPGPWAATPPPSLAPLLRLHHLNGPTHPASASEIRFHRHGRQPWDLWLPRAVATAIEERQLYR